MFAVFFETEPNDVGKPQYLVFPYGGSPIVFHRVSDGGKGGTNRWSPGHIWASQNLTAEPTTVLVTEADVNQYVNTGMPSTLTSKAMKAHAKSPATTEMTTDDIMDLPALVAAGDASLNRWLRDGRRVRPVVQPVAPAAPAMPVRVTPNVNTEQPAPVVHVPVVADSVRMALVPPPEVAKRYVHRTLSGVADFDVFEHCLAKQRNLLLYGPTGPGKTTVARAFAAHKKMPIFMVSGTVSLESSQLFGRYIPDGVGGFVWQDGGVTEVVRHGGVLVLDEVNFIPSKIATVLFSLLADTTRSITLLDHKGETIMAHPNLLIVATMNPHYAGTQEMNEAFKNRFAIQRFWGYDDNVEKQLVKPKSLRELAKKLRAAEAKEEITTPTPTNALMDFVSLSEDLGLQFAIDNFVARYKDDEQEAVGLVIDAHMAQIKEDLASIAKSTDTLASSDDDVLTDMDGLSIDL